MSFVHQKQLQLIDPQWKEATWGWDVKNNVNTMSVRLTYITVGFKFSTYKQPQSRDHKRFLCIFYKAFLGFKTSLWLFFFVALCCMTRISKAHIVCDVHIKRTSCVRLPSLVVQWEIEERRYAAARRRLSCGVLARLSIKCQRGLIDDCFSSGLGLIWR